jgi:hypothetical protein
LHQAHSLITRSGRSDGAAAPSAEVERVIVTDFEHSSGRDRPEPVDRPQDIEAGIHNATDLTTFIPQEGGGTVNQNISMG